MDNTVQIVNFRGTVIPLWAIISISDFDLPKNLHDWYDDLYVSFSITIAGKNKAVEFYEKIDANHQPFPNSEDKVVLERWRRKNQEIHNRATARALGKLSADRESLMYYWSLYLKTKAQIPSIGNTQTNTYEEWDEFVDGE